jgi:hypothetical protein
MLGRSSVFRRGSWKQGVSILGFLIALVSAAPLRAQETLSGKP